MVLGKAALILNWITPVQMTTLIQVYDEEMTNAPLSGMIMTISSSAAAQKRFQEDNRGWYKFDDQLNVVVTQLSQALQMRQSYQRSPSVVIDMTDETGPFNFVSTQLSTLCLLYTSPSPRDKRQSRMPSSA